MHLFGTPEQPRPLQGKVALITGGSSGIGEAIALEFARQGGAVAVHYHSHQQEAEQIVDGIRTRGGSALAVRAEVSQSDQVRQMIQDTVQALGKLDVLVNSAGIEKESPFLDKPEEEFDRIIAVDLKGAFLCGQAAARQMVRQGKGGTIINISSVHEDLPFPGYSGYVSAKGGLRMLCRNMALELAPYHINVVNVGPGAIATPINRETLQDPQKKAALEREIPLGRIGSPEEVAKLVAYLTLDDASYITGTTIFIDGGLMRNAGSL